MREGLKLDLIAISTPLPREKVLVALFLSSLKTEKLEKPNSELIKSGVSQVSERITTSCDIFTIVVSVATNIPGCNR
jgi:hypothetical protein